MAADAVFHRCPSLILFPFYGWLGAISKSFIYLQDPEDPCCCFEASLFKDFRFVGGSKESLSILSFSRFKKTGSVPEFFQFDGCLANGSIQSWALMKT